MWKLKESRKRRWTVVAILLLTVAILVLFLPTIVAPWAPVLHSSCERGIVAFNGEFYIPVLLLNSPYAGHAWGNVTFPDGFLPGNVNRFGTQDSNGGAAWDGFEAGLQVSNLENVTLWGAGSNSPCSHEFETTLAPTGNDSLGIPIIGPGNVSDSNEPVVLSLGQLSTVFFSNGFNVANSAKVSTCGASSESIPMVTSSYLSLSASFEWAGQNQSVEFTLPILQSVFHYAFPANYGTWQVDNLSAPGGPGGGWAFSYSPCA
jgi:hypothetical protein